MGYKPGLNRLGLLTAAVAFVGCCAAAMADDRPSSELAPGVSLHGDPGTPDISGLWLGTAMSAPGQRLPPGRGPADDRPPPFWAPWPLPYTPEFQKISDERAAAARAGRQLGDLSARCLPFGMPRAFVTKHYPDEIVQTPGAVTILVWGTFPITIWTDGRPHPKDLAPSYNGHSIGYWAGDTLFVDTAGIRGDTPIDEARDPHSPRLHMKTTVQRVAKDTLHVHVTLYDEGAFTVPVVTTNIWQRKANATWQVLDDASCFENSSGVSEIPAAPGFSKF